MLYRTYQKWEIWCCCFSYRLMLILYQHYKLLVFFSESNKTFTVFKDYLHYVHTVWKCDCKIELLVCIHIYKWKITYSWNLCQWLCFNTFFLGSQTTIGYFECRCGYDNHNIYFNYILFLMRDYIFLPVL